MASEEVSFLNQNIKLAGTLYKPESNAPYPAMVVVHPASEPERGHVFYEHLISTLPQHGMGVLVFDRRGSGASEGDFQTADFEDLAGDVISAVEYLQSRSDVDKTKIGLHGTSQGAWIAPIASARKPDIAFIVVVSASGVSPAAQMDYGVAFHLEQAGFERAVIEKALELRTLVNEYFRGHVDRETAAEELHLYETEPWFKQAYLFMSHELPADITQSKWHYEMDYEPLSVWAQVDQPVLFLFAAVDEWVPIEQSMLNYKQAVRHIRDVTIKQIANTNHLMSTSHEDGPLEISGEYLNVLIDWLVSRGFGN
jgi:alpha/beta superfamily hydrolase